MTTEPKRAGKCEDILPLIPAYALGATDAEETARVEAALDDCPQARAELESFRVMMGDLREDVPQVEPPTALRGKLQSALADHVAKSSPAPQTPKVMAFEAPRPAVAQPAAVKRQPLWIAWAAAAAVVALVVTNGLWALNSQNQNAEVRALEQQNDQLAALLDSQQSQPQLTSLTGTRSARLNATTEDATSYALVLWSPESSTGLLYTDQMPALGADQVYQLWMLRGDERISAGIFDVDDTGRGTLFFTIPEAVEEFELAGITAEPDGGSPAPTTSPVVAGELQA